MRITKKFISIVLALLMIVPCFSIISFAEEAKSSEHLTEVPEGYVGIYTKTELNNMRKNRSGKYILMNDIVFDHEDYAKDGSFHNMGMGWSPIGTSSYAFRGIFDGNGYTISNIYINNPDCGNMGLFGYAEGATIKNLTLKDSNITGATETGGIAGRIYNSTIDNCNFDGSVIGTECTGGIAGDISGSTINNCNFDGSVIGTENTGGIVGLSYSAKIGKSTISYCVARGTVTGSNCVGGIAGYQSSIVELENGAYSYSKDNYISYCCNASSVTGQSSVGGITGESNSRCYNISSSSAYTSKAYVEYCCNSGDITAKGSIAGGLIGNSYCSAGSTYQYLLNSFNCGNVSANSYAGGLIGRYNNTSARNSYSVGNVTAETGYGGCFGNGAYKLSIGNCYYLDKAVTEPTCTAGTAKDKDQLKEKDTYEQWDFTTIWTFEGREDYLYPEIIGVDLILSPHKHRYTSEITTPATHLTTGVMTFTCGCGDTYTEVIAKTTEHTYNAIVTAPTCIEQGYTTYTCECGVSFVENYVDVTGHDLSDSVVNSQTGVTMKKCLNCDYTEKTEFTLQIEEMSRHAFIVKFREVDCETGDQVIDDSVSFPGRVTKHNIDGLILIAFSSCADYDTYEEIAKYDGYTPYAYSVPLSDMQDMFNKTFGIDTVDFSMSQRYDPANEIYYSPEGWGSGGQLPITICENGQYIVRWYEIIDDSTLEISNKPHQTITFNDKGQITGIYFPDIPDSVVESEHTYISKITKEATHLEEGIRTFTCVCGDSYTETISKTTGHTYASSVVTESTCTEQGYTTYTCECGDSYIGDYVSPKWHVYTNYVYNNDATEYLDGTKTAYCDYGCGLTYTLKEIGTAKNPIIIDIYPGQTKEYILEPGTAVIFRVNSMENVGEGYWFSLKYPKELTPPFDPNNYNENLPIKWYEYYDEMNYGTLDGGMGNCLEGEEQFSPHISKAGQIYYIEVMSQHDESIEISLSMSGRCTPEYPREAHTLGDWMITEPGCNTNGKKVRCCTVCQTVIESETISAIGHTPAGVVEENYVAPTCTEKGSKDVVVYCSVCNEELSRETVVIDATGHMDNDDDGYCDMDSEVLDPTIDCECNCHKSGITKFFFNFILFFQKLFGSNRECACGIAHY